MKKTLRSIGVVGIALTLFLGSTGVLQGATLLSVLGEENVGIDEGGARLNTRAERVEQRGVRHTDDEIIVKVRGEKEPRVVKVPTGEVERYVDLYKNSGADIEYAEPNFIATKSWVPNDSFYNFQWNFDNATYGGVGAEEAWEALGAPGNPGQGVIVAVVDTGVAYEDAIVGLKHYYQAPDLANTCFVQGYDFVNNDSHPNDDESHGTHVTGTIAQSTNNASGVAGLAFGACIMPVKVLDRNGSGTYANVAAGIRYAADNGAKVINLSLGGPADGQVIKDAVAYAYGKGVTVVAASGNENTSVGYPAAYDQYVIAVGATRYDETRAPYSNFGTSLDIVAPGGDTTVDQNGDGYVDGILQQTFNPSTKQLNAFGYYFFSGTSMATPHVAAAAAMVIGHGNATTPTDVRAALETTADDLGTAGIDMIYGHGLLNIPAALAWTAGPVVNKIPVASAGVDQIVTDVDNNGTENVTLLGTASFDLDGTITDYAWSEGAVVLGSGATLTSPFSVGVHTVTLTVTDNAGATATDTVVITVLQAPLEVFRDSFEVGEWNGLWTEDSQNDWQRSTKRAIAGSFSAQFAGPASNSWITSIPINLQGKTNATVTFSWFIENTVDTGEYLAFDVSTNGGTTWTEYARLRGNIDAENTWHNKSFDVNGINSLMIRFRGRTSESNEHGNVDTVVIVAR